MNLKKWKDAFQNLAVMMAFPKVTKEIIDNYEKQQIKELNEKEINKWQLKQL